MENKQKKDKEFLPDSEIGQKNNFSSDNKLLTEKAKNIFKKENFSTLRKFVMEEISEKEPPNNKISQKEEGIREDKFQRKRDRPRAQGKLGQKNQAITPKLKNKKKESNKKASSGRHYLRYVFIFLVIIGLFFSIFGVGIVRYNWDNKFSNFLLKFVPYPAVVIGKDVVLYKDYRKDVKTVLNNLYKIGDNNFDQKEIESKLLNRIIANKIIEEIAKKYKITISDEEIEKSFNEYAANVGSTEELEKILNDFYLWNPEDFKKKLLKPILLEKKVNDYLLLTKAQSIEEAIKEEKKKGKIWVFVSL